MTIRKEPSAEFFRKYSDMIAEAETSTVTRGAGSNSPSTSLELTESVLYENRWNRIALIESKSERVNAKRRHIVESAKKYARLAESANITPARKRKIIAEAKHAYILAKSSKLTEAQLDELGGGVMGGIKNLAGKAAGAVGGAVKRGAQAVGGAVKQGAQAVGNAASAVGGAVKQGAQAAGQAVGQAAGSVQQTYQQGANQSVAKQAMSEIEQIGQFLAQVGIPGYSPDALDTMTFGQVKQMLQGVVSPAATS